MRASILIQQSHLLESEWNHFFERKAENRKARAKGRIQPKHYGEALTEDEVFKRIKQQQEERGLKKKVNSRKAKQGVNKPNTDKTVDENICQGCGDSYVDDDAK